MAIYKETKDYKLIHDNMLNMANYIENGTIDCVITDPPYELGFMGKKWDGSGIAFNVDAWKKCFNALKDGGYLLAFGGTRTFHRIACAIEDAGFEIRDTIMWLYGSGFPKSMDISKAIDKKPLANRTIEFKKWLKIKLDNCGKSYKQINDECGFTATSYSKTDFKDNWSSNHPNKEKWLKMKEVIGIKDNEYDWVCENNVEERGFIEPTGGLAGGSGYTVGCYTGKQLSNNAIDNNAKKWSGWGTALKPAYEPIIVARKPMKTSVAENVLKNGVGGINIDECRIPFGNEKDSRVGTDIKRGDSLKYKYNGIDFEVLKRYENDEDYVWSENLNLSKINVDNIGEFLDGLNMVGYQLQFDLTQYEEIIIDTHLKHIIPVVDTFKNNLGSNSMFGVSDKGVKMYKSDGRFPANILHDNSDEVVSGFPSEIDTENASRFFYTAKASKKDRDEGLDAFDEIEVRGGGGRAEQGYDDNDEEQQRLKESAGKFGAVKSIKKNTHPTVKPIELMQYLVRLVAPKGATILDCFMGSNSTGKAVMFENRERNANYKFIGIELTDEYLPICEARIDYAINKYEYDEKVEMAKTGQLSLFDFDNE